jgi:phospholipid transport system substrate-binding protein
VAEALFDGYLGVGPALVFALRQQSASPDGRASVPSRRKKVSMRGIRRTFVLLGVIALGVVVAREAGAGPVGDQLRSRIDHVVGILEDPIMKIRPEERRRALRDAAGEIFDFTEITRRSLGRHWQTATPAEREELVALFTARLERAYLERLEQYDGERISVVGDLVDGDLATVRTRLVSKDGVETPVDYRLYRQGERWLAYDITVEGVSLVAAYRAQFNTIVRASSTQALVARLRAKQQ